MAIAAACGSTLNVFDATTGRILASHAPVDEEDVILHVDACTVSSDLSSATAPRGAYVAYSTRALQVSVLRISPVAVSARQDAPADEGRTDGAVHDAAAPTVAFEATVVRSWTAAQHAVGCLRFSPRGDALASGSTDGNVKIWGVHQHFLTHNLRCQGGGLITSIVFDNDQTRLLVGTFEGHVSLWDLERKASIATARPHTSAVDAALFLPGGRFLTVGRDRQIVQFAGPDTFETSRSTVVAEHVRCATVVGISAASKKEPVLAANLAWDALIFVGAECGAVASYAVPRGGGALLALHKHQAAPLPAPTSPTAEGGHEPDNGDERAVVALAVLSAAVTGSSVTDSSSISAPSGAVIFSANGAQVVSVLLPKCGATTPAPRPSNGDAAAAPRALPFALRVDRDLVTNLDQVLDLKLISAPTDAVTSSLVPPTSLFRRVVVTNSCEVRVFSGEGCVSEGAPFAGHSAVVVCAALSPCGAFLVTGSKDQTLRVWSLESRRCVAVASGHNAEITSIGVTHAVGGDTTGPFWALSASADTSVRLWDFHPARRHLAKALAAAAAGIEGGAEETAADAEALASFEPAAVAPLSTFEAGHDGPALSAAWAPNNRLAATGGKDKLVVLWAVDGAASTATATTGDAANRSAGAARRLQRAAVLRGHRRAVNGVAFSPVDRVLASASNDGTVRLWSLVAPAYSCVRVLQADKAPLLQVCFFNAGTQLVTSGADGLLRVWAAGSGECVTVCDAHSDKAWALAVAENGGDTFFVSGAADGTLVCTEDITAAEAAARVTLHHETVRDEQALANAMRGGDFARAFSVALRLNHPRHLRQCVARWMSADPVGIQPALAALIAGLAEAELDRLLEHTRDFVTNARHCNVAAVVMRAFLASRPLTALVSMARVEALLEGLWAYFNRHAARQQSTLQQLCYVDWATRSAHGDAAKRFGFTKAPAAASMAMAPAFALVEDVAAATAIVGRKRAAGEEADAAAVATVEPAVVASPRASTGKKAGAPAEVATPEAAGRESVGRRSGKAARTEATASPVTPPAAAATTPASTKAKAAPPSSAGKSKSAGKH